MNDRESFYNWFSKLKFNCDKAPYKPVAEAAWQHQQKRIDMLENNLEGVEFVYKKALDHVETLEKDIESLQAKLTIAVNAMENLVKVKGRHNTEIAYKRIEYALAEIKLIGG